MNITAARATALFSSDLSTEFTPAKSSVVAAIRSAVRAHGGIRGCAGEMAAAYGEYPEIAIMRMRWARQVIEATYDKRASIAQPCTVGGAAAVGSRPGVTCERR